MQQGFYCPNCHSPVQYQAQSCGRCGINLSWEQPPNNQGKQKSGSKWRWLIPVMVIIVLVIAGGFAIPRLTATQLPDEVLSIDEGQNSAGNPIAFVTLKNKDTKWRTYQVEFEVAQPYSKDYTNQMVSLAPGEVKTVQCLAYELGDWTYTVTPIIQAEPDPPSLPEFVPPPADLPTNGIGAVSPYNGSSNVSVSAISFSWTPFEGATKYKFVLATDAAMTTVIREIETTTATYQYIGALNHSTDYFWRVMAVEPVGSDWSATWSFRTE